MINLLIKKEYRNKFKFTNFLYNDLWGLCEKYFDQIDEQKENATKIVNALVACYNIVLYCGRTAIDDNTKIDVENFIKNQIKPFLEEQIDREISAIFFPSGDDSIIVQLFNVSEQFLHSIEGERLMDNFQVLRGRTVDYLNHVKMEHALNI